MDVETQRKVAVAKCARVSYTNPDGTSDLEKDLALYERLSTMGHWSPFEHVARAMTGAEQFEDWRHYEKG